jgi:hypothetical protein
MSGSGMAIGELEPVDLDGASAFHLPTLGWLFAVLAGVQAILVGQSLHLQVQLVPALVVTGDSSAGAIFLRLITTVATVLLPAAILYRAPMAWRTHRLLLVGAMLVAAWTVGMQVLFWFDNQSQEVAVLETTSTIAQWGAVIHIAGLLLLGVGLAHLRQHPASERANVVRLVAVLVAVLPPIIINIGPHPGPALPLLPIAGELLTALAAGYLLSVPLGAWLDQEPPHRFWMVLGILSLALLAIIGTQVVQLLLTDRSTGTYFIDGFGIPIELVVAVSAVVTLALYARALPDAAAPA